VASRHTAGAVQIEPEDPKGKCRDAGGFRMRALWRNVLALGCLQRLGHPRLSSGISHEVRLDKISIPRHVTGGYPHHDSSLRNPADKMSSPWTCRSFEGFLS
jgi:hypothetical protein